MTLEQDPNHPIIDKPWQYAIIGLNYQYNPNDWRNSYIDLTLQFGNIIRRLRFLQPQNLKIDSGFPQPTGGMQILDVRKRQWESIGVEVSDFEASAGKVTFLAREVIDLDVAYH